MLPPGAWSANGSRVFAVGLVNGVRGIYKIPTNGSGVITRIPAPLTSQADYVGGVTGDIKNGTGTYWLVLSR
jgi:hypothetical protein